MTETDLSALLSALTLFLGEGCGDAAFAGGGGVPAGFSLGRGLSFPFPGTCCFLEVSTPHPCLLGIAWNIFDCSGERTKSARPPSALKSEELLSPNMGDRSVTTDSWGQSAAETALTQTARLVSSKSRVSSRLRTRASMMEISSLVTAQ